MAKALGNEDRFWSTQDEFRDDCTLRKVKRHTTVVIVEDVERESGSLIET